jgi:ATP-dependent DNA helicase PIF1
MTLIRNIRLDEDSRGWSDLILQIGNGTYPSKLIEDEEYIEIPHPLCLTPQQSIEDLLHEVYGQQIYDNPSQERFHDCIILTPRNKDAQMINNAITEKIQGNAKVYKSADSTCFDTNSNCILPDEFLNGLNPSGLPPHELKLKVGIPIILIRTIAPKAGLYNGTRLGIDTLQPFVITATILSGQCIGNQVKIPRIDFYFKQPQLPFTLIRICHDYQSFSRPRFSTSRHLFTFSCLLTWATVCCIVPL